MTRQSTYLVLVPAFGVIRIYLLLSYPRPHGDVDNISVIEEGVGDGMGW